MAFCLLADKKKVRPPEAVRLITFTSERPPPRAIVSVCALVDITQFATRARTKMK